MATTLQDFVDQYKNYDEIYKNKEVFNPDWAPEELEMIRHRDEQIDKYVKAIMDFIHHDMSNEQFLVGPNSTGKTLVIRYWEKAISEVLEDGNDDLEYIVVPCGAVKSWRYVVDTISIKLGLDVKVRNSPAQLFGDLFEKMEGSKYIIVFDEIDKLAEKSRSRVIKNFSRPKDTIVDDPPQLLTIVAGNDISAIEELDWGRKDRTHTSSFNPTIIDFQSYGPSEIKDIMEVRFQQGLNEKLYSEELISSLASRITRNLNSDIRLGLKAVESAISHFQSSEANKLKEEHINKGIYEATESSIRSKFNVINNDQTVLIAYCLSELGGYASAEELVSKYREMVEDSLEYDKKSRSTLYRYLNELGEYKIIKVHKSGKRNQNEYEFKKPYKKDTIKKAIEKGGYLAD